MRWMKHLFACGGVLALALGSVPAQAAEPAASKPAASKPAPKDPPKLAIKKPAKDAPPTDLLTRDELRACMDQDARRKATGLQRMQESQRRMQPAQDAGFEPLQVESRPFPRHRHEVEPAGRVYFVHEDALELFDRIG